MPVLLEPKCEYLVGSNSVGLDAEQTKKKIQKNNLHLAESEYLSPFFSCREMLFGIAKKCFHQNWDGHGAEPISAEVYRKTSNLIREFPIGLHAPELVPENDGAITLEWHENHKQELLLSINPNNIAYYVFVDGSEKKKGSYVLQESLPPFLINMINQLVED